MVCVTLASVSTICEGLQVESNQPWLSTEEQERLNGFASAKRRRQFLAGRWLARHCLASTFGGEWLDYPLSAPEGGKPEVLTPVGAACGHRFFSLSHSADWLACAVAAYPVGVDIEDITRRRDVAALAELTCSARERRHMSGLSPHATKLAFHARWSLKEAWIKRSGLTQQRMDLIAFQPCEPTQDADAVVMQGDAFVAAVMPAPLASLHLLGLHDMAPALTTWRCCDV